MANFMMKYQIYPVTHYQQNCSLIWCDEAHQAALIDPGGETERLLQAVTGQGATVEKVLLTHGHLDHVGAAREVADRLGVPIVGPHKDDGFWLQLLPKQAEMFGFPGALAFEPDQWLQDGDQVSVGNVKLSVLHCPGHTPGHITFFDARTETLFVGDVLFKGSIGRTDFPRGDYDTLISSIKEKLLPLGDEVTLIPGHGPASTLGEERQTNPFLNQ